MTIADAITNPNLNGTYLVTGVSAPAGVLKHHGDEHVGSRRRDVHFHASQRAAPSLAMISLRLRILRTEKAIFNASNAQILSVDVAHSTFTVNFNSKRFSRRRR